MSKHLESPDLPRSTTPFKIVDMNHYDGIVMIRATRLLTLACLVLCGNAWAQYDAIRTEFNAALQDAQKTQLIGPAQVNLLDEAVLQVPAEDAFVPQPAAARLLKAMGNTVDERMVGLVFPVRRDSWMVVIQFEKSGYIKDGDARGWDVDELLKSVQAGTERGNVERKKQGFPEIEVLGWADKPHYDSVSHRLVWAIIARDKGAATSSDSGVNYNTYILGRDGYFKLNLVTDTRGLALQRTTAENLADNISYVSGKQYGNFVAASDRQATFGVSSLVAGLATNPVGAGEHARRWINEYRVVLGAGVVAILVLVSLVAWRSRRRPRKPMQVREVNEYDDFPATEFATVALDPVTEQLSLDADTQPAFSSPPATSSTADAQSGSAIRPGHPAPPIGH